MHRDQFFFHVPWKLAYLFTYLNVWNARCTGVDVDVARNRERLMMMDDANQWLKSGEYMEKPHDKTGAMALHIAAAKGYTNVIKSVLSSDVCQGCQVDVKIPFQLPSTASPKIAQFQVLFLHYPIDSPLYAHAVLYKFLTYLLCYKF